MYPEGVLIYLQKDPAQRNRVQAVLTKEFPHHYLSITRGFPSLWPQDSGMQLGDTLYTTREPILYMFQELSERTSLSPDEIHRVLPLADLRVIEGGLHVPIPRSGVVASAQVDLPNNGRQTVFSMHGWKVMFAEQILLGLQQKLAKTGNIDWIYGTKEGQHLDCVLTGIDLEPGNWNSVRWYIDSELGEYLQSTEKDSVLIQSARLFPHDLALRGGLNIAYQCNGSEWVTLVPSVSAIGPLVQDLINAGYRIVELGEDQVRNGGGIKCRSLAFHWRT